MTSDQISIRWRQVRIRRNEIRVIIHVERYRLQAYPFTRLAASFTHTLRRFSCETADNYVQSVERATSAGQEPP